MSTNNELPPNVLAMLNNSNELYQEMRKFAFGQEMNKDISWWFCRLEILRHHFWYIEDAKNPNPFHIGTVLLLLRSDPNFRALMEDIINKVKVHNLNDDTMHFVKSFSEKWEIFKVALEQRNMVSFAVDYLTTHTGQ